MEPRTASTTRARSQGSARRLLVRRSSVTLEGAVRAELEATVDALRSKTTIVEIEVPFTLDEVLGIYAPLLMSMFTDRLPAPVRYLATAASPVTKLSERLGLNSGPVWSGTLAGTGLSHHDWLDLNERRTRLRWACRNLFSKVDVLLTPAVAFSAPHHNTTGNLYTRSLRVDGSDAATPTTSPGSHSPHPPTCPPQARPSESRRTACRDVQIISDYLDDQTTIQFAELLAEVRGGFQPRPLPAKRATLTAWETVRRQFPQCPLTWYFSNSTIPHLHLGAHVIP